MNIGNSGGANANIRNIGNERTDIRAIICRALQDVAPEADLSTLSGSADVREALDIDSMDFLRFVVGLHEKLNVSVPEKDYAKIRTLETCIDYVSAQLEAQHRR